MSLPGQPELPAAAPPSSRRAAWLRWLGPVVGVALAGAAGVALHRVLASVTWTQVVEAFVHLPVPGLVALALLPLASLVIFTWLDRQHGRHLGVVIPWPTALTGVTCAQGISLNIGNSLVMGGAVRLRIYGVLGLPLGLAAVLSALNFVAINLGVASLAGGAWLAAPTTEVVIGRVLAGLGIVGGLGWVVMSLVHDPLVGRTLFLSRWLGRWPSPRVAVSGLLVGAGEKVVVAGVLLVLLPPAEVLSASGGQVLAAFWAAIVIGKWSQVPGGLGVIEAAFLGLLPRTPEGPVLAGVLAAFIVFRLAYYLVPLAAAGVLMLVGEARVWRWLPRITP